MSSKDYVFLMKKLKYGGVFLVVKKFTIKCIGGDNMKKEKTQLVFIDNADVPNRKRKEGKDWGAIFGSIPEGKSMDIVKSGFKVATVKSAVQKLRKEKKIGDNIKVVRRILKDKPVFYVMNVAEVNQKV